jgi:hypothetical protein
MTRATASDRQAELVSPTNHRDQEYPMTTFAPSATTTTVQPGRPTLPDAAKLGFKARCRGAALRYFEALAYADPTGLGTYPVIDPARR